MRLVDRRLEIEVEERAVDYTDSKICKILDPGKLSPNFLLLRHEIDQNGIGPMYFTPKRFFQCESHQDREAFRSSSKENVVCISYLPLSRITLIKR